MEDRSLSFRFSCCSLYVGTRSSQGTGTTIDSSRYSSACSGTSDCTKNVLFSGSRPAPIQSATFSYAFDVRRVVSANSLVKACRSVASPRRREAGCSLENGQQKVSRRPDETTKNARQCQRIQK